MYKAPKVKKIALVLWILVSIFFLDCQRTQASTTKMKQRILPVKFVYVDSRGRIDEVWSNVELGDDQYVLKFLYKNGKEKGSNNSELLSSFSQKINGQQNSKNSEDVKFLQKDNKLEEVHTYS